MAYADSAIDYTWEILKINVEQRLMQVKYSTADSARPDILLNLEPRYDEFNESDLSVIAVDAATAAVVEWSKIIEAVSANPSFDPSTLEGNSYNNRYKVRSYESAPIYNTLTSTLQVYDSEGPDDICTKHNIVALNDSDKASVRETLFISPNKMWKGLQEDGRLDSALSVIGLTGVEFGQYDADNIDMLLGSLEFADSATQKIQTMLAYNDSDWAEWLSTNGAINRSIQEINFDTGY